MTKEIPNKNYIILAVIILITILAVFYARNWYITTKEYNSDNSPVTKAINEIHQEELDNYALENSKFILYTSSGLNPNIKNFETKFRKFIINKNLSQSMLYINTADIDLEHLNRQLKNYAATENIKSKINSTENVNMYIFENQKIISVITETNKLEIKQINEILKENGMLDNA